MPGNFDEQDYRRKLIEGGLSEADATTLARRTALAQQTSDPQQTDLGEQPPRQKSNTPASFDFRSGVPAWVKEIIDTQLAIEAEDARSAGQLGFMARALVIATMPYKDPKLDVFTRQNGDFRLRIVAGYEGGIPYGIYPRLLMSWVATEAVRKQSPMILLGDSLREFLQVVLDIRSSSGGPRGATTRVAEQMKRLFGSLITAQYSGSQAKRGFMLRNVMIADELVLRSIKIFTYIWDNIPLLWEREEFVWQGGLNGRRWSLPKSRV